MSEQEPYSSEWTEALLARIAKLERDVRRLQDLLTIVQNEQRYSPLNKEPPMECRYCHVRWWGNNNICPHCGLSWEPPSGYPWNQSRGAGPQEPPKLGPDIQKICYRCAAVWIGRNNVCPNCGHIWEAPQP